MFAHVRPFNNSSKYAEAVRMFVELHAFNPDGEGYAPFFAPLRAELVVSFSFASPSLRYNYVARLHEMVNVPEVIKRLNCQLDFPVPEVLIDDSHTLTP